MSSWNRHNNIQETVYSDYTPVEGASGSLEAESLSVVAGLQVDDPSFFDDPNRQPMAQGQARVSPALMPKVVATANMAPKPPPRLQQGQQAQQAQQAQVHQGGVIHQQQRISPEIADTRPPAPEIHSTPLSEDPEMSPGQLLHVATSWAKNNGFSNEQLMEFGHLLQMVAATFIPRNQISNLRALDQGSFGQIYSGVYDGSAVAVKQCSSDGSQIQLKMRELLLELSVLVRIRHPNIVTFWGTAANFPTHPGAADNKPYIGMVFELCEKGSLYRALHQNGLGHKLDHKKKMRVLLDVGRGMSYIHAKGIIHRDLNSRNILLSHSHGHLTAKVADFGCARKVKGAALTTTTISGSPAYMAPEQLEGKDLTDRVDVWAFGVLFWEIMCDQPPWASKGNSLDALKHAVSLQGERLPLPSSDKFPNGGRAQYIKLMEATWHVVPTARPSMSTISRNIQHIIASSGSKSYVGEHL
mmetsp:Transcript_26427/g.51506  ORF Transcript_26427/g.51506 Transcript_26427/m.51506 type:complete len:470 (+) Transcript_26427:207-1616(+)